MGPSHDERHELERLAGLLRERGVGRIHVLAWRDLDDPDAGGSEEHAAQFMSRWAAAGLDLVIRTSRAAGRPERVQRDGYHVVRRGSRYSVFGRAAVSELTGRMGRSDALVEVWNGVPWFSPIWYRRPSITFLHHVHGPMWDQIFPGPFAAGGRLLESRLAPPFYRRRLTMTPSDATRDELLALGFRPDRVVAVPNGVDEYYQPGGVRSPVPTILNVARLAPVKRQDLLIQMAARVRHDVPNLQLVMVGDGPERERLQALAASFDGGSWVRFTGRVERDELRSLYRQAWLVASTSVAEGWGLSLTEAAACGTPAVAIELPAHRCSVVDGVTGLVVGEREMPVAMATVLTDDRLRDDLGRGARDRAQRLTWDASARSILAGLLNEVEHRPRRRARH